jgi:hypothetical protein
MSTVYHFLTTLDRLLHLVRGIDTYHPNGPACPLRYVGGVETLHCLLDTGGDLAEWEAAVVTCPQTKGWVREYKKLKAELVTLAAKP